LPQNLGRRLPALVIGVLFLMTSIPLGGLASASANHVIIVGHGASSSSVTSVNWSGYAVTAAAGSITEAQGSWIVPSVTCGSKQTSYSAFWVGIDGYSSTTVEQTGTDSDCSKGTPHYYAWYEFYPKASKDISLPVHYGNVISASVTYASGVFTVTIQDVTSGQTFSTTGTVSSAQRSSAEFVVEAPETCLLVKCKLSSLSNFGTASFGSDYTAVAGMNCGVAENGGPVASIGGYGTAIQEISMVSQANHSVVKAQPSALSSDGTSFTVQWLAGS
jgi:Peptidase A4 family